MGGWKLLNQVFVLPVLRRPYNVFVGGRSCRKSGNCFIYVKHYAYFITKRNNQSLYVLLVTLFECTKLYIYCKYFMISYTKLHILHKLSSTQQTPSVLIIVIIVVAIIIVVAVVALLLITIIINKSGLPPPPLPPITSSSPSSAPHHNLVLSNSSASSLSMSLSYPLCKELGDYQALTDSSLLLICLRCRESFVVGLRNRPTQNAAGALGPCIHL